MSISFSPVILLEAWSLSPSKSRDKAEKHCRQSNKHEISKTLFSFMTREAGAKARYCARSREIKSCR